MTRYIFVTGGVASSLGKGVVFLHGSLDRSLNARGDKVRLLVQHDANHRQSAPRCRRPHASCESLGHTPKRHRD